ncbi:MAG: hypothetical protein IJV06_00255 [Bacteroidaceae bacterium]|nr:hypothetical protein [Bacteroidaceae bacterium]MBQ9639987.1 hypothetical protein [Bacteroidaceae bacterium]
MSNVLVRTHNFIQRNVQRTLLANRYYNWYVFSRDLSRKWEEEMETHYREGRKAVEGEKAVVFLCNGFVENGGWADRLKGILSTYMVCKEMGVAFRLLFTSPFSLTDYLVPNSYDWRIFPEDVVFEHPHTEVLALEIGDETAYQAQKQYELLRQRIADSEASQIHVCTNAHFCYQADFAALFHELFRPSPRLMGAIGRQLEILGKDYISLSARFINSLGDFADTATGEPLPPRLRERLIGQCMEQIELLHREHPEKRILINSDSVTFLSEAQRIEGTYVVPGHITHLDVAPAEANYQFFEKTFVDFFLIANASAIYRLETLWLRKSGFPYAASKIHRRPFHSIQF